MIHNLSSNTEMKKNKSTEKSSVEEEIIHFDKIDERIHNLSIKEMNHANIKYCIQQNNDDVLLQVEDQIKVEMENIGMEEQFHIYFLDMIKYHICKNVDGKDVIREYPIILENLNSDNKAEENETIIHHNKKSYQLYNWDTNSKV